MLASYMPLKIKNELAERRGKEEITGGDEDATQPKKEEEESVIDVIMKNYHLIDPISSKYINDTKNWNIYKNPKKIVKMYVFLTF